MKIEQMEAFKVFTAVDEGLRSVFAPTFKGGLIYPPNERIRVDTEEANFFAFKELHRAVSIARQGRRRWNMVKGRLVVLPITMFEVVAEGMYHVPSEDLQCCDGWYPAAECKEIIVHDSEENRLLYDREIVRQYLDLAQYSMSAIERDAFKRLLPDVEILNVAEKRKRAG